MNLSEDKRRFQRGDSGAGGSLGTAANAGPAPMTVGAVGFGPAWTMEDSMAASIVRLECEADELRAEVAMLKQGMAIVALERDEALADYRRVYADFRKLQQARFAARAGMTTEEMREDFLKEWRRDT